MIGATGYMVVLIHRIAPVLMAMDVLVFVTMDVLVLMDMIVAVVAGVVLVIMRLAGSVPSSNISTLKRSQSTGRTMNYMDTSLGMVEAVATTTQMLKRARKRDWKYSMFSKKGSDQSPW